MANATVGADPMTSQYVSPVPIPSVPVNFVASHEELVRSARDLWAVAVSLLTELTPDKFATAPWAAGLFTAELPFILAKLWHLQQAIITTAHSYLESEAMLTTILETIDVPKLFEEFSTWAVDLAPLKKHLPFGLGQHVPPIQVLAPEGVDIIEQRYAQTTWSEQSLIRHEVYEQPTGELTHWFYLPKREGWDVFGANENPTLLGLRQSLDIPAEAKVHFVGMQDGAVHLPGLSELQGTSQLEGTVTVYKVSD